MKKTTNRILGFEIWNRQKDYAACLEVIRYFENAEFIRISDLEEGLKQKFFDLNMWICDLDTTVSPRYFEEPLFVTDKSTGKSYQKKILKNKTFLASKEKQREQLKILEKTLENLYYNRENLFFYLRVHFKEGLSWEDDVVNFQYLALLLHRVSKWGYFGNTEKRKTIKKLTVFLVPTNSGKYPFIVKDNEVDNEIYNNASHYLRLLSKQYTGVIYGVTGGNTARIMPLDFKKASAFETNFPLIPIDSLRYVELFENNPKLYEHLFALKSNERFGQATSENPLEAIRDVVAETSFRRLEEILPSENCLTLLKTIKQMIISSDENSIMAFALFSFTLLLNHAKTTNEIDSIIQSAWYMACELSRGIRQIVQNALQHSQFHECFFSFCLHIQKDNESFYEYQIRVNEVYPETILQENAHGMQSEALEIFISDLNEQENMLDCFKSNLLKEYKNSNGLINLEGHKTLLEHKGDLSISNFFSEFNDEELINAWSEFRKEDLMGHLGLSLFALVADEYGASVKVISNTKSVLSDKKQSFYKSYSEKKQHELLEANNSIIPGTQFSILIPIKYTDDEQNIKLGQLQMESSIKEDYESYADFLDYTPRYSSTLEYELLCRDKKEYTDANMKYHFVLQWYSIWSDYFKKNLDMVEKEIVVCDLNRDSCCACVNDRDELEVCLKGFVGALSQIKEEKNIYLAVINLPAGSLKMLRDILVLSGIRKFPSNLQIFLCEKQYDRIMTLVGNNNFEVFFNAYILAMEHGIKGFGGGEYKRTIQLKNMFNSLTKRECNHIDSKIVLPFDIILKISEKKKETFFETRMSNLVELPLERHPGGYKLEHTHMRLGSKIHIESFYEMSFLFYRTAIANRIAFAILKDLKRKGKINLLDDEILFYGYASYSKAILTSVTEILRMYRKKHYEEKGVDMKEVGFASYQHNLQSESEAIQMYFNLPKGFSGNVVDYNILELKKPITVVQIVPINSTLNTFDKMWNKIRISTLTDSRDNLKLKANYALFWVSEDLNKGLDKFDDDKLINRYIETNEQTQNSEKYVLPKFKSLQEAGCQRIDYFMKTTAKWHDPLKCSLCYPDYVIDEVPLVETDSTSTVPAQQIRFRDLESNEYEPEESKVKINNERLLELKNCVSYGHIVRRQNHYQYYIDTQKFFYQCKGNIMKWLQEKRIPTTIYIPTLHIIFSPEHNTNVGFAQYVNTYCFGGMAEIISINIDKEFRSNFQCEHSVIAELIRELYKNCSGADDIPVKFYFVDDTIITGETFNKANSFLHSLIPEAFKKRYQATLFEKVFLLLDRMSDETKQNYVQDVESNFLSYVHIDVSNMRNQGDSCVGCKLEKQTDRMFKRSPTRKLIKNWTDKDYRGVAYDNLEKMKDLNNDIAYKRLLISHILQNLIIKEKICSGIGDVFDIIIELFNYFLKTSDRLAVKKYNIEIKKYSVILDGISDIDGIELVLKTVCRPFFSFDFQIKQALFTLLIFLSELLMGAKVSEIVPEAMIENVRFLFENSRVQRVEKLLRQIKEKLHNQDTSKSIMDVLFECLTDMESNYLLRRQTIERAYFYIKNEEVEIQKEFWMKYSSNIYRLISNSSDETKELWLECICLSGLEYKKLIQGGDFPHFTPRFIYNSIVDEEEKLDEASWCEKDKMSRIIFYQFCHELFFINTGVNFDGLEMFALKKDTIGEHSLDYWKRMKGFDRYTLEWNADEHPTQCALDLFNILMKSNLSSDDVDQIQKEKVWESKSVKEWYAKLLLKLKELIQERIGENGKNISIALLTEDASINENKIELQNMDFVEIQIDSDYESLPKEKYKIKNDIIAALKYGDWFDLKEYGYTISGNTQNAHIIVLFDNPYSPVKESIGRKSLDIGHVYLYISIEWIKDKENREKSDIDMIRFFNLRFILRDILTYRNRILRMLEQDFSGDILSKYAHTIGEKNILSHEKAYSHSATSDDKISIEIFTDPDLFINDSKRRRKVYQSIDELCAAKWLLLRNYTNGQIAKLFTRGFSDNKENISKASPLYVSPANEDSRDFFRNMLCKFSDLGIDGDDGRMDWIKEIIDIQSINLKDAEFITGYNNERYNLEYFKCIMIDMFISAIKYKSNRADFLLRINDFSKIQKKLRDLQETRTREKLETENLINEYNRKVCRVWILREKAENEENDYLVILNEVNMVAHELSEWKIQNDLINQRLNDPLDFADGHMSLLAIKRYIENLNTSFNQKCQFGYVESAEVKNKYNIEEENSELYFHAKLPVLTKKREMI